MNSVFLKSAKYLIVGIGVLMMITILGLLLLFLVSPGKTDPFTNNRGQPIENSISTIEKIKVGGINQYLIMRGIDSTKPILLFLHGGPGTPEISYLKKYNPKLEKDFVVVYWQQRGAGKSYNTSIPIESMNIQQFVSDAKEVSEYLIERFNQDKIYLMGHSWGSFLGIKTVNEHPNLYHAYFGIGQVVDQYRSEIISFEWVKEQAKLKKDKSGIKHLDALDFPSKNDHSTKWLNFLLVERSYIDKYYGGLLRNYKGRADTVLPLLLAKEYTLLDKLNYTRGAFFSFEHLWAEVMHSNFFDSIDSLKTPVHFLHGLYDYQTTHLVAKEFYDQLKAVDKSFFTFHHSAHSPILDEPDRFNDIIKDLVNEQDNN